MKVTYWSNSKLADWIRGTPKPKAATMEEWAAWRKNAKVEALRYWIAEEFLDDVQDVVFFPQTIWHKFGYWYHNRFISQRHVLKTGLKKGKWHEFDQRLLHGMFNELVDFVECEGAWMDCVFDDTYKRPWFRKFREFREPERGIKRLKWQMGLKMEYGDTPDEPSPQAEYAKELYTLYLWWKEVRPARPDPYDVSGWNAYCASQRSDEVFFLANERDEEDQAKVNSMLDQMRDLEKQYDDEDEEMMIRLIKLRKSMWRMIS